MELKIEIEGHTYCDLELALAEVMKKVQGAYRSGEDSNETGNYSFEVNGIPVEQYAIKRDGALLEERFDCYYDAEEYPPSVGDCIVGLSELDEEVTFNQF